MWMLMYSIFIETKLAKEFKWIKQLKKIQQLQEGVRAQYLSLDMWY